MAYALFPSFVTSAKVLGVYNAIKGVFSKYLRMEQQIKELKPKYNRMINNKTLFEIYLILRAIIISTVIILVVMIIMSFFTTIDFFQVLLSNYRDDGKYTLITFSWILIYFIIIDERIRPAFIEFQLTADEIIIKTYNPHLNRWESPFILFGYKKRITELKISKEEYYDYKLTIGKFGLRKELRLQKMNNNGVFETSDVSISLLRKKEYMNLISDLDRLKN